MRVLDENSIEEKVYGEERIWICFPKTIRPMVAFEIGLTKPLGLIHLPYMAAKKGSTP
jgi:hypothetical protein